MMNENKNEENLRPVSEMFIVQKELAKGICLFENCCKCPFYTPPEPECALKRYLKANKLERARIKRVRK